MRVLNFDQKKGELKVIAENLDDLWVLYNIVLPGDKVYAYTFRRVRQDQEEGRSDAGRRVRMRLGIVVEDVNFHRYSDRLRIKGTIIAGSDELCSLGAHHTFNIGINDELKIVKEKWSAHELNQIQEAVKSASKPSILILAIDSGEATIATVTNYRTQIVVRITESLPGKRADERQLDSAVKKFYENVARFLENTYKSTSVDAVIIAGPGFVKENFLKYLKNKNRDLASKVVLDTASSGDVSGIEEVIKRGAAVKAAKELRVFKETELVEEVLKRLGKGSEDVVYGLKDVEKAVNYGAVDTLLVTDELFRELSFKSKNNVNNLLKNVESTGGKLFIISTQHQAGEQLNALGGIAALLRFKIT
ncbi:MAG: mRNA surveillance protein pelota [Candidatus Odinarchaeia archaeon]